MEDQQDNLSPEQTDKLLQFQDLTGIEQMERCREIMESHDWNIEAAVQDTFNEQEGVPRVFQRPVSRTEERAPIVNLQPSNQRVILYPGRRPQGIFQWTYYLLTLPLRFAWSTFLDIFKVFISFLRPDPRRCEYSNSLVSHLVDPVGSGPLEVNTTDNVTDPGRDVENFLTSFEEKFGVQHPVFYRGTYSQALNDAKKELKFLLVYLHSEDHQNTETFCREVLCNETFSQFVNTQMLFWACNTSSPEGYRVSQALREHVYPFFAVIVLRENRMSVVARIEGHITGPQELVTRLEQIVSENESSLVAARADRAERSFNQTLRQEQDEAYLQSLRADQEKERKKREERQKEEEEARRLRQLEEEKEQEYLQREERKSELQNEIPSEPELSHPDAIRILLKTPAGGRIERRFLMHHSMKYLYYFVFCHQECPDDFQIVTNYPKRTLPCEPQDGQADPPTFQEFGLGKSEMLFVHDNDA